MMNKKLVGLFSLGVLLAIIALWSICRIPSIGNGNSLLSLAIKSALVILAFPAKVYVELVQRHGSWSLPLLALFLAVSGILWGVVLERVFARVFKSGS